MIPSGVRAALAQARLAIERARENDKPAKDRDQILDEAEEWRERTYEDPA